MKATAANNQVSLDSRHSRLLNAKEYAKKKGRKPLTPEQHIEFMKMVAEFTNL